MLAQESEKFDKKLQGVQLYKNNENIRSNFE